MERVRCARWRLVTVLVGSCVLGGVAWGEEVAGTAADEVPTATFSPRKLLPGKRFTGPLGLGKISFTLPRGWKAMREADSYLVQTKGSGGLRIQVQRYTGGSIGAWVRDARAAYFPEPPLAELGVEPEVYLRGKGQVGYLFAGPPQHVEAVAAIIEGQWVYQFAMTYSEDDPGQSAVAFDTVVATLAATPPATNAKLEQALVGCWGRVVHSRTKTITVVDPTSVMVKEWYRADGSFTRQTSGFIYSRNPNMPSHDFSSTSTGTWLVLGDKLITFEQGGGRETSKVSFAGEVLKQNGQPFARCE